MVVQLEFIQNSLIVKNDEAGAAMFLPQSLLPTLSRQKPILNSSTRIFSEKITLPKMA